MIIDCQPTALIIVDVQNDFVLPIRRAGKAVPQVRLRWQAAAKQCAERNGKASLSSRCFAAFRSQSCFRSG
ncbi:MAG: hypothetical protein LBK73_00685 [Treponema sp.]|nr:hypothetical protein [Treponema sp.]